MKQPRRDAHGEGLSVQNAEAGFVVAEMQMMPYDSGEEHQQNGCWKTAATAAAAVTSVTLRMPLAPGISAELSCSQ